MSIFDSLIDSIPETVVITPKEASKPIIGVISQNTQAIEPESVKVSKTSMDILNGIEFGKNWYEVTYTNDDIRYTQHSTKENLNEYYKRLNDNFRHRLPSEIKPIGLENNRIIYI